MQVKLFKKFSNYTDSQGNERTATNFFVDCGGILVPVEVKYFESKETGKDDRYRERRVLLSAFAEELPDKAKNAANAVPEESQGKKPNLQSFDDDGSMPF